MASGLVSRALRYHERMETDPEFRERKRQQGRKAYLKQKKKSKEENE